MRKLRISLDDLKVESFDAGDGSPERGTVLANSGGGTNPTNGPDNSNPDLGCGSGGSGCDTYYDWSGCDYSCVLSPCY